MVFGRAADRGITLEACCLGVDQKLGTNLYGSQSFIDLPHLRPRKICWTQQTFIDRTILNSPSARYTIKDVYKVFSFGTGAAIFAGVVLLFFCVLMRAKMQGCIRQVR